MRKNVPSIEAITSQPLFKGVEKPTTVLANMIVAEILLGNFKMTDKNLAAPVDDGSTPYFGARPRNHWDPNWETKLTSEKFIIETKSQQRLLNPSFLPPGWGREEKSNFHAFRVILPVLSFDETEKEIMAQAVLKRTLQVFKQREEDIKFSNQQKAVDAIENWLGIK